MRGYVLERYGGPEAAQLRDVPEPAPGPRELLLRVHAAGLNPVDYKIRQGKLKLVLAYRRPIVMGSELAGVVEQCGAGASRFSVGERVFARVDKRKLGGFAERACVHEDLVARMPASLDFDAAAGVPLAGLTALQCLRDELRVRRGQRIFITGGAGGVGTFAIQLAKWLGAEVTTTASPRGDALVRKLGADVVVDYTRAGLDAGLRDFDGALDLVGGDSLTRAFAVVKRGGTVVSIAAMPEPRTARDMGRGVGLATLFWLASFGVRMQASRHGVRYRYLFMHPSGTELAELARLVDEKQLEVVVDRVFPFAEIAQAFAYLEQGRAKGKVVVRMLSA